ncbi:MAG TPA: MmcQ/YjbR family DNA-binding protein [Gaiellaceae bacterium]|nr:MmcQ/YjbR family DNA-binding protein [Gaiellaceae bacterium]
MVTWEDVLELAQELPETEVSTSYGRPALKVRGKFVAALRSEPPALVVRCDLEEKPLLLEARPDILFETPHYHGWGYVLVRLEASRDDVREFLIDSWLLAAPKRLADTLSVD